MDEHVLLLESETVVRGTVAKILTNAGYHVHTAQTAEEAARMAATLPSLSVLVSDGRLGRGDGPAQLQELRRLHPKMSTVIVAGESVALTDTAARLAPDEAAKLWRVSPIQSMSRPFEVHALAGRIAQTIAETSRQRHFGTRREQLHQDVLRMVDSLAEALESRDPYTHGHSLRVADYAVAIAEGLGLSAREQQILKHGAALHDIGKIAVRQEVLHKPGRLNDDEFEHIKIHPVVGREILEPLDDFKMMLDIVYHHHERIDGRGYPENLKGDKIPYMAQIVAVADTYDAMTSDRPYRQGMAPERAIRVMREVSGVQLNGEFVERLASHVLQPPAAAIA
ncbi:MAG: HD domain-containing phosphohydrolase [Candidatus Sericytochromatia bacterium]|nr:HD domain-containing phosphohydrolase [Candidatus Sericytochromatia bacterium]